MNHKKTLALIIPMILVLSISAFVLAKPNFVPAINRASAPLTLPEHAVEVAPGIFYLGTAIDNGRVVEGYAFIDYKKGFGKPVTECGNGICEPGENVNKCPADCGGSDEEPDTSSCYGFLAKGAKWKSVEDYIVNPSNEEGLDSEFISSNFALDIAKWETAAGVDILGDEVTGTVDGADLNSPDNQNEVYFADVGYENAIAITIVWGYFSGPPFARELVEWDMIFDDVDFDWSAIGEAGKMDFENIATHELGHSVGLDDLYTSKCSEETMYGYSDYGETKKRTLEAGDIVGINSLY